MGDMGPRRPDPQAPIVMPLGRPWLHIFIYCNVLLCLLDKPRVNYTLARGPLSKGSSWLKVGPDCNMDTSNKSPQSSITVRW